jgi:selenocysteine-specific elongation factor
MIIGTAGHIDHGKSALVTALTGRAMDRLAEERQRGITIDLNFAPLDLGNGRVAGVVDVPGHEDFVRTMVAGASGIDLALLVVAADEGVMPQTVEHLSILEQLGVPLGIPVITKADLVDAEWLELVRSDLVERLAGSPVAFQPPVVVSARTGMGIPALLERIVAQASTLTTRPSDDLFRLPIDRAFSVAGVGTVVTGTAWSGRIAVGDPVVLLPDGDRGRVRSIEIHGSPADHSEPGSRTAVGIGGVERSAARRGTVLVSDGAPWVVSRVVDVDLSLETTAPRVLAPRTRVRLHLGTAEVMARVQPRDPIPPGAHGFARLKLEAPLVARGGDRFVLRSYSPVITIGGGRVLDPMPPARRTTWSPDLASADPGARLGALLERRVDGVSQGLLPILLGTPESTAVQAATGQQGLRVVGSRWVLATTLSQIEERLLDRLRGFHRGHPSDRGMPLETLRHSLAAPAELVDAVLQELGKKGRLRASDGLAAMAGFAPRVEGGQVEIDRIVGLLEEAQLTPPSVAELERSTGRRDLAALLRLAAASGRIEAVERDRYYARPALDRFVATLREIGVGAEIVPGALRDRLGISRKYLIPLLEWADAKGVTQRVGEGRKLR